MLTSSNYKLVVVASGTALCIESYAFESNAANTQRLERVKPTLQMKQIGDKYRKRHKQTNNGLISNSAASCLIDLENNYFNAFPIMNNTT